MANNFLATANRVAAHLGKAPKDFTKEVSFFCAQEKIVGSRPPNRVRNCVTDL